MKSKLLILAWGLVAVLAMSPQHAEAAVFDFVADAANNGERGLPTAGGTLLSDTPGFTVDVTANHYTTPTTLYHGYLDRPSGGPGGLGVCKTLTATLQCTPSNDDNITFSEVLNLDFGSAVTITHLTFSNGDHKDVYNGDVGVQIDDSGTWIGIDPTSAGAGVWNGTLTGTKFSFIAPATLTVINGGAVNTNVAKQIYISTLTAVPEPGFLSLLGLGFGAMYMVRRRKQNAETAS